MKRETLDQAFELVSVAVPAAGEGETRTDEGGGNGRHHPPRPVSLFLRPENAERFREEARKCGLTQDGFLTVLLECFSHLLEHNQVKVAVRRVVTNTVPVPVVEFPRSGKKRAEGY